MIVAGLIIIAVMLIISAQLVQDRSTITDFEIDRRLKLGETSFEKERDRREYLPAIYGVTLTIQLVLFAAFSLIAIINLGWVYGTIYSLLLAIIMHAIGRVTWLQSFSGYIGIRWQSMLSAALGHINFFSWLFRTGTVQQHSLSINSRDELINIVKHNKSAVTVAERAQVLGMMSFNKMKISDVMTKRDDVLTVDVGETLGPLTLNALFKHGHSVLPVTSAGNSDILGMLYLDRHLEVSGIDTEEVRNVMVTRLVYVNESEPLIKALIKMNDTHSRLLVVVNKEGETVGIVSFGDILDVLFGDALKGKVG